MFFVVTLCFFGNRLAADWQIYQGSQMSEISAQYVLLEPENWSRKDLLAMRNSNIVPLARISLVEHDPDRLVAIDIRTRDFVANVLSSDGRIPVIFYSKHFLRLIRSLLRDYSFRGFSGVVFAGVYDYNLFSDRKILRERMKGVLDEVSRYAYRLNPEFIILIEDNEQFTNFVAKHPFINGVITQNLFSLQCGKPVRLDYTQTRIKKLSLLSKSGRYIFTSEIADSEARAAMIRSKCATNHIKLYLKKP